MRYRLSFVLLLEIGFCRVAVVESPTETGLYYLQSRYYDPVTGRFVNADENPDISAGNGVLGTNLFQYCGNDPVNFVDQNGHYGTPIQWVCAVIGGIAGWYFGDYVARAIGLFPGKWYQWQTYAYWTVRELVIVGGSVLGWISPTVLFNLSKQFLVTQPKLLSNVIVKLGTSGLAVKIIYEMIKLALYDAGSIALSVKKCPIARAMWHNGLYGGGKSYSSSALNNKIKNSSHFKDKLNAVMNGVTGNSFSNKNISLNFTNNIDTDLYLAIGKINLNVSGTKSNGKWTLTISGKNKYDFDYSFLKAYGLSFGNFSNDVGLVMQKAGMMKPYDIIVRFSTTR